MEEEKERREREATGGQEDASYPRTFHYQLSRSLVQPGLTKPRYNRQPTELMKAKLKGQSLLINLRRARKKQMTGVQATKRWWTRVFGTPRRELSVGARSSGPLCLKWWRP